MLLTKNVRFLLSAIWRDTLDILSRPMPSEGQVSRKEFTRLRVKKEALATLGVRWDIAAWLGRSVTHRETSSLARTAQSMEGAGLLWRNSRLGGNRTTHVRLTPEGRRLALELTVQKSPVATRRHRHHDRETQPASHSHSRVLQSTASSR